MAQFYTAEWGTYQRHLHPAPHAIGKAHTQKIERKPLTLRPRIKRSARTTKAVPRHAIGMGLFVNRDECGLQI
jgi:insertion element IS1 protein InsB